MSLYKSMKTNPKLETSGIWLNLDHSLIRVGRAGGKNSKFLVAFEKIARENKRTMEFMTEEQSRKLLSKAYAEIIVLDWLTLDPNGLLNDNGDTIADDYSGNRYSRGISGPDEELLEFNVANILKIFEDIPDVFKLVKATAEDASLFRSSFSKEIEGN